ncbi:siderophore-interacting protein [Ideonella livida]|uniref:Siderophore-interacting protein n=1 Tax=Ideonella livida TaxID=2707176 RepID=A0A7C9PJW7_9BURK|nr:siderophore-interacting protein [Ideonella livida]NDY93773.1 siderophore-interacting protein [Ideonella livida]
MNDHALRPASAAPTFQPPQAATLPPADVPVPQRVRHALERRPVTVAAIEDVSPHLRRIRLQGEAVKTLVSLGFDDHVKLLLPPPGERTVPLPPLGPGGRPDPSYTGPRPVMRDYTPLAVDTAAGTLDLMFALHGEGPASRWAAQAQRGDAAVIGGPRGSAVWPVDLAWQWLVGDESALPAISRRLQELPESVAVTVVLDLAHPEAALPALALGPGRQLVVVPRPAPHTSHPLLQALAALPRPQGRGLAWVAAERQVARDVRGLLLDTLGLHRGQVRAAAYWTHGQADFHENLED